MMTDQVKIGGKIKILTDKGLTDIEWIDYRDRVWLTPLWLTVPGQPMQRPLRIIAPRFAPGMAIRLEAPHVEELFQKMPIPASLLERGVIPPGIAPLVEVHENPDIVAPHLSGLH